MKKQNKMKIVKAYNYRNEKGKLLFQVCRLTPKDFRQRRPNGKQGWLWSTHGVDKVPYRLPELLASDPQQPVFIVEGEKDVDNLIGLKLIATTNPGGALKWSPDYNHYFKNRQVIILPDNDEAGKKHAKKVAQNLIHEAASLKIVELPNLPVKGDVSDWLKAGGSAEKLLDLVTNAQSLNGPQKTVGGNQESGRQPSQATLLVKLAESANLQLFHTADKECYATVKINNHKETMLLKEKSFRHFLMGLFYEEHQKAPHAQAVQNAIGVLEGKALFKSPELPIFTRVAGHQGNIYFDLGNDKWEVIEITPLAWQVISSHDCPVRFRRPRGMAPLPYPETGGCIDELREFMNYADEKDFILIVSWLVAALNAQGPYTILAEHGEHGTGKSTNTRVIRLLVDPNKSPLRSEPREERELVIAANNSWLLAFDNFSFISNKLSDALCRLATGGGFATRELYTDKEEILFDAQRPVLINGIEELATRPDLLDRLLILYLPRIPESRRRAEREFWQAFELARPRIMGVLYTAVSTALRNLDSTKLSSSPRMADFTQWVVAAETAFGWPEGTFLTAYKGNRRDLNELALEASVIAQPLQKLAEAHGDWSGTATALKEELSTFTDEETRKQRSWPKDARSLSGKVRRLAPNLRAVGIDVEFRREQGERLINIGLVQNPSVQTVPNVQTAPSETINDGKDDRFAINSKEVTTFLPGFSDKANYTRL
ncbi:MAG: hypothetical protein HYR90_04115 [Candidatus Andersenbacteria bacterium]|nr:hypothetical protein [Candidatus Andersenbacteria bacterium]MBI3250805.1 hypothetical protein [Candidatus Andersenbacteria bacterium]